MKSLFTVFVLLMTSALFGQTWEWSNPQPCGNSIYRAIIFNDNHCLVFGSYNTVMSTTDGGQHWSLRSAHDGSHWRDAVFSDSLHGWIVGGSGA